MDETPKVQTEHGQGTIRSYLVGFVSSLALTLTAYFLVTEHVFSGSTLVAVILVLAVAQFWVQLVCFLHLGHESSPRWNLTAFAFMLGVLFIVVFGSLWIMNNLDYNHMTPTETDEYIIEDEGIKPY